MARDYGKVRAQFWDDDALRELSIEANYLALYLITSSHTNAIGCFRLPIAYILNDTRLDKKALERALGELRSVGYAIPCERIPWIYIPKFLRHNPPENPNVWRKCIKELEALPGEIAAAGSIAAEMFELAGEDRMCREGAKGRVSDEEKTRLKRFENGIETVSHGLLPYPCPTPIPNLDRTEPTLPAKAGAVRGDDPDFEEFWKTYRPPPNSKKPEAKKAWEATAKARPAQPDLLRAVSAYNTWLAEEGRKQKREYPKQHPSTWLRGEVWQGYLTAAVDPEQIAANKDRADKVQRRGKYAESMQ